MRPDLASCPTSRDALAQQAEEPINPRQPTPGAPSQTDDALPYCILHLSWGSEID